MAIYSGYFNSINGDRKYNAETMSQYFKGLISKGVLEGYANKFVVQATNGMNISVATGKAYFSDGKWIESDSIVTLPLKASDVVLDRIDRVVLRKDNTESSRSCGIYIKTGTPASEPVAPEVVSDESVEELSLATIYVGKLSESITQLFITDTRADSSVCGFVQGLINQVDISDLFYKYALQFQLQTMNMETEFDDWFTNVRNTLSTSTLVREFTQRVVTTEVDQTVIPFNMANYNPTLDILEVYINGLRLLVGEEYTLGTNQITLIKPLDIDQIVEFVVFKSTDGYKAETVIDRVEILVEQMAQTREFVYYANGENDNIVLSQLAQDFYAAANNFTGISENQQMKITVVGTLGAEDVYSGTGTANEPAVWFALGKVGNTLESTRKLTFDFSNAQRLSLGSVSGSTTVAFNGNDLNIIGLQLVLGGSGSLLQWFNGQNINIKDCMLFLNASTVGVGSSQGGFFERCRLSVTAGTGKANVLVSNGTTILKTVDCELLAYNGSSATDESVAILSEANKTESVVIVDRCNIPLRTRSGYKQSQTIKINSGYCSLTNNVLGKAPALYSTDTSKCSNVGSMIISK